MTKIFGNMRENAQVPTPNTTTSNLTLPAENKKENFITQFSKTGNISPGSDVLTYLQFK